MSKLKEIADKHLEITTGTLRGRVFDAMQEYADVRVEQAVEVALRVASDNVNLKRTWSSADGNTVETEYVDGVSMGGYRYVINSESILSLAPQIMEELNNGK